MALVVVTTVMILAGNIALNLFKDFVQAGTRTPIVKEEYSVIISC